MNKRSQTCFSWFLMAAADFESAGRWSLLTVITMHAFLGSLLRFLHDIRRHRLLDVTIQGWLITLLLALIPLAWLKVVPGKSVIPFISGGFILALLLSQWWGRRHFYVHFIADNAAPPAQAEPLWPLDKLLIHASGPFSVEGKFGRFTHLLAYYRTFETREHTIMARCTPTRFLRLAQSDPAALGMWYIFFMPEALKSVTSGDVYFGGARAPGLRLKYIGRDKKDKPEPAIAYLHFDSEPDRQRLLYDLTLDLGGPAQAPWRPSSA